jgi:GNAT acetyltransferase
VRERSPDGGDAPRMWIGGTAAGSVVRLRHDVEDEAAAVLGASGIARELTFVFEDAVAPPPGVRVVTSGTPDGDELAARIASEGMPAGLAGMGFEGAGDLWEPWCAALEDGAVVSVAFGARVSPSGAEIGVATAPEARGRGLAGVLAGAWWRHPELAGRACFYTAAGENRSSLRVAQRLGLRLLGPTISVI